MRNSYLRFCFLILVLFGLTACQPANREGFAIYLLAKPVPVSEIADQDLSTLALHKQPLIRQGDITSYDWERHAMELTSTRIDSLQSLEVPVNGLPFVVTVDREPIYSGALWPSYSSLSYNGVVIDPLIAEDGQTVRIQLGYPESPELFEGEDPRANQRIRAALEAASILD